MNLTWLPAKCGQPVGLQSPLPPILQPGCPGGLGLHKKQSLALLPGASLQTPPQRVPLQPINSPPASNPSQGLGALQVGPNSRARRATEQGKQVGGWGSTQGGGQWGAGHSLPPACCPPSPSPALGCLMDQTPDQYLADELSSTPVQEPANALLLLAVHSWHTHCGPTVCCCQVCSIRLPTWGWEPRCWATGLF
jgi:hypothetical protein